MKDVSGVTRKKKNDQWRNCGLDGHGLKQCFSNVSANVNCLGILFRYRFCFITSGLGPGVLLSEYQGFPGLAWQNDGPPLRVADAGPRVHRALCVESQWILVLCGFYKVAEYRISKYWTIDAEGNTELGLCEPLVTAFLPSNQYTILFYMCFFFFFCLPWWLSG